MQSKEELSKRLRLIKEKFTMKLKQKNTHKAGFTLIELIVVMAIIAILVLLAAPKFLGYTEKANQTRIKNDIKVLENSLDEYLITHEGLDDWADATPGAGQFYDRSGKIDTAPDNLKIVDKTFYPETSLDNKFYVDDKGNVIYENVTSKTDEPDLEGGLAVELPSVPVGSVNYVSFKFSQNNSIYLYVQDGDGVFQIKDNSGVDYLTSTVVVKKYILDNGNWRFLSNQFTGAYLLESDLMSGFSGTKDILSKDGTVFFAGEVTLPVYPDDGLSNKVVLQTSYGNIYLISSSREMVNNNAGYLSFLGNTQVYYKSYYVKDNLWVTHGSGSFACDANIRAFLVGDFILYSNYNIKYPDGTVFFSSNH